MKIKLGIAPINWCNDDDPNLGHDITFEQCMSEMAEAGFVGTEIGHKYPRDPAMLNAALSQFGLTIPAAWFSTYFTDPNRVQETLSRFLDHMSYLRAVGAHYINICECGRSIQQTKYPILGNQKPVFNEAEWQSLIQGLHQIGRIAYDFGMKIVYHYHAGTGVFTEQEIDFLMKHTSPELVYLLLDTGHAAFANIEPITLISRYQHRIQYVHLKDIRKQVYNDIIKNHINFMDAVRAGVFTVPGDGDINFADIIKALANIRYQGWMLIEAEQDPHKAPPLRYAKMAYQHITSLLGEHDGSE